MIVIRALSAVAVAAALSLAPSGTPASPTPIPGGANQITALSGTVGQTLWNGMARVKINEVRDATPDDHPESLYPSARQKAMVITGVMKNGTNAVFINLMSYTLADADDVTIAIPSHLFTSGVTVNIAQGAATKVQALFLVDKNYRPTKLLVQCETCGKPNRFKPFRIAIPAAGAPAAAPTS